MTNHTIGIDISKAHLDAYAAPEGRAARFWNDAAGFQKLIGWIGPEAERIAYEPSGPWHRDFEEALLKAGLPLYAINPYQVRCFARSQRRRAKTDAVDARTAIGNRGKHLRHPLAMRVNRERLAHSERQLKRVDAEIRKLLETREDLKRRFEILTSIPGISNITAAGLIVHMSQLGTLTGPRAASLAGLAPLARESEACKRRSFIQGGREKVRRLLSMPAVAAIRCNPHLGRKYTALRDAGKPPMVAITAVMRKLVVLPNILVQQDRLWIPEPATAN